VCPWNKEKIKMPESVTSEVVSAMVGGMFSASALYPLEVLKTRMQAESKVSSNPQEETTSASPSDHRSSNQTDSDEEKKQQLKSRYSHAASHGGMSAYASLMYQHEGGIRPFYYGVLTSAVQSATEKALYFFAYTFFKNG
jgi:hypothetical protein